MLTWYSVRKRWTLSSDIKNKTRMLTLSTFIQHSIGSPRKINEARKINLKSIQVGKEEIKMSSFAGNMVLYIKSLKNSQKEKQTIGSDP